jgi:hypothetical protein
MSRLPVVLALTGFLAGCGPDPSLRCQLQTASGACISVLSVVPTYFGQATADVDVVQDVCEDGGTTPDEPFSDHLAVITINNAPPVEFATTPADGPAVVFDTFTIKYVAEPPNPGPNLDAMQGENTATVLAGQQVAITYPLVSLYTKRELFGKQQPGELSLAPVYAAEYTLSGHDPVASFTLPAHTTITMGDFNNCGATTTQ